MNVRTRFAPSPTGYMHVGGLRTALYAYLYARHEKGTFILRIEDTDQEREVPGALEKIYESLREAGLSYDEGPDAGGDFGPYIQSRRQAAYLPHALELIEKGAAYPCFCTKERLEKAREAAEKKGETFKYDKHCLGIPKDEAKRRIDAGEPYVIRQNMPVTGKASFDDVLYGHVEVDCATLDDTVLIKADGMPTYNFANVIDDHLMRVSHVMRGTEYLSSAPKYNLLYDAFGWEKPCYVHLAPVMADAHRKLSKRHGDPTFEDLLNEGYLSEAIVNYIALLGWSPGNDQEFFTLAELEAAFQLKGLSKSPAIFDKDKLTWMNSEYIRNLPFDRYLALAMPWFGQAGVLAADTRRLAELTQGRTEVFGRIPDMVDFLAAMPDFDPELYSNKKMKTDPAAAKHALALVRPVLAAVDDWREAPLHDALMAAIANSGMKNGQVLWPLRIAISGRLATPGGAIEIAYLLGKAETLRRVDAAAAKL
ncbi:MAG: glutamate--tRNA ligase [Firmicutes bacterium]|nr:glutamate--tRNA ligase [Bacillota bacterium]